MISKPELIYANWPAPHWVRAYTTMRTGGYSQAPYNSMNLSYQVGDDPNVVQKNHNKLHDMLSLPTPPVWLKQVHGINVIEASRVSASDESFPEADGSYTAKAGIVCAVLTADCLPVLICDQCGTSVAAVHAGWRGLLAGVIEAAVMLLARPERRLMAWLGPAIGPGAFEVGDEVRQGFIGYNANAQSAFRPSPHGRWLADIYQLARLRLMSVGVQQIYGGEWCTFNDSEHFYSYRRDGTTGRMASLIWLSGKLD